MIFCVAVIALATAWPPAYATTFSTLQDGIAFTITSNLDEPFTLNSTNFQVDARTLTGDMFSNSPEPPYSVHLWVTFGGVPNNSDTPRESRTVPRSQASVVGTELSTTFRLPVIGSPNPRGELEPGLTAANMVGGSLFFTLCLDVPARPQDCVSDQVVIHPKQPTFLESPALSQENQATLYWETLPRDNNNLPVGHSHRITFTNQVNDATSVLRLIRDRIDVANVDGRVRNRLILNNDPRDGFVAQPGVAYQTSVQACAGFNVCGEARTIQNVTRFANFTASTNRSDGIEVSWVQHARSTPGYLLSRCEVANSGMCEIIDAGPNLSYTDESTVPGIDYQYSVFACPSTGPCDGNAIPTGISNVGQRKFALPDPATFVEASDGDFLDRITVTWSEFSPAADNFPDARGYRVFVTNSFSPDSTNSRDIRYQPNSSEVTINTGSRSPLPSGVELLFEVYTCGDLSSDPSPDPSNCVKAVEANTGYSKALIRSESPSAGVAKITWNRFSTDTDHYRIMRCTVSPSQCTFIPNKIDNNVVGTEISFSENDLNGGDRFTYKVHACPTSSNSDCAEIGETSIITIAREINPDVFEIDNSPDLLVRTIHTIRESLSQDRTFHEITDQDWARIRLQFGRRRLEVITESGTEGVNTQLTLFDARGRLVACALNTPGGVTTNAQLRLPNLSPGDYFLRAELQDEEQSLSPVTYKMTTNISIDNTGSTIEFTGDCKTRVADFPRSTPDTIVAPILEILLQDD